MDTLNYDTEFFQDLNTKVFDTIAKDNLEIDAKTVSDVLGKLNPNVAAESFLREHKLYSQEYQSYEDALEKVKTGDLELVAQDKTNLFLKGAVNELNLNQEIGVFGEGGLFVRIPTEVRKETQGSSLSNISSAVKAGIFKNIGELTGIAVDLLPDETQEEVANYFKSIEVGDKGESVYSVAEKMSRAAAPLADPPQVGGIEKAIGETGAVLLGGKLIKDIAKSTISKVTKKSIPKSMVKDVGEDVFSYGTAAILMTDADESLVNSITESFPESKEYLNALVVNPTDPRATEYFKRLIQEGVIVGSLSSIIRGASIGIQKTKAIKNGILKSKDIPVDDKIKEINIVNDNGEFVQEVKVNQPISLLTDSNKGSVETNWLSRNLTSKQGFDEKTFRTFNKKSDQAGADAVVIRNKSKKLQRAIEQAFGIKYKDLNPEQITTLNNALGKELSIGEGMSKKIKTAFEKPISKRTDKDREILEGYYSQLNDASRANQKEALDSLPEELKDTVLEMRRSIDSYSNELSKLGFDKKINATIDAKNGIYMNTEYEAFVNPAYMKKLKKAVKGPDVDILLDDLELVEALDGARNFFKRQLEPTPKEGADVDGLMNQFVESITKGDVELFDFLAGQKSLKSSRPGTDKVLNTRELIPSELRRVLRQVDDPLQRFSATLKKQTDLISEVNFINDIKKIADNSGYSSDIYNVAEGAAGRFTSKLEGSASPYVEQALGKNPLADVFVTKDFKEMFDKGLEVAYPDNVITKSLAGLGSAASLSQTVLSEATHLINVKGNMIMMAANGNLDALFTKVKNVKDVVQAVPKLQNLYGRTTKGVTFKDQDINVDELSKMYRLGLIDNSVTAEMITKGFDSTFKGPILSKVREKVIDPLSNIYRGEDAAFKLLSYYKELDQYAKAFPDMPTEQIEQYAAEVVKNTLPSYSNLPRAIKALKGAPLGAFPAFFVESIRTAKNIAKIGMKDLKNGAALTARGVASGDKELIKQGAMLTRIGTRRTASMGAVAYGAEEYFTYRNSEMGITPREDQILSSLGPRWENGTTLKEYQTSLMMNERGDIGYTYVNQSFSDPYDVIRKIYKITAAYASSPGEEDVNHIPFEKYLMDNLSLLAPVVGPSLMVQSITEAITGEDEYGQPIGEGGVGELVTRLGKAAAPLEPRTIKDIREIVDLVGKTDVGPTGYPKRLEDKLARLYGTRQVTVDLGKSVRYNAYKINSKIKSYENVFNKEISKLQQYPQITVELKNKLYEKLDTLVVKSREEQAKLTSLYDDIKSLSYRKEDKKGNVTKHQMSDKDIYKLLSREGTEKIDDRLLTSIADRGTNSRGVFTPFKIKNKLKKIKRGLPKDQGEDLIREIENRYANQVNTPLLTIDISNTGSK
jgi:hypothetical protein